MTRTLSHAALAAALALVAPARAAAEPHPLPMTEPYETLIEGKLEVEQQVDAVPVRVEPALIDGPAGWRLRSELLTELRHGWSDKLELGVSIALRQDAVAGAPSLALAGLGQRARYRIAQAGDLPVDVAVQVAATEHADGVAFAERLVLSRRSDTLVVIANLEVAQRYVAPTGEWRHAYLPAAGVAYEVSPRLTVGAEYWARARFDRPRAAVPGVGIDPDDPGDRVYHYAGPTVMVQSGRVWLSAGAHVRLDRITSSTDAGDPFGRLWVRARLGLEL